jgi:uncharacterized protein (TIGR00369 family)
VIPFRTPIPFVDLLGMELLAFDTDRAEIALVVKDEFTNSWGVAHGGLTMTLLDVTMAHAARSPAAEGGEPSGVGVVTIEMKTSFLRPGQGRLVAEGRRLLRTASLAFCEGTVRGADGQIVGHATGTFKFLQGLPVGGRRVRKQNASD